MDINRLMMKFFSLALISSGILLPFLLWYSFFSHPWYYNPIIPPTLVVFFLITIFSIPLIFMGIALFKDEIQ